MTDAISLGNIARADGAFRLTGTASRLDTSAIVEAAYEAKRVSAVRLERKIEINDARSAAYADLRTILGDLQGAVDGLRNPPGFLGAEDNVFEQKQVFLSGNTTAPPDSVAGVIAGNTADAGSFRLEVQQLAAAHKLAAGTASSADQTLADALNGGVAFSGTLEIGLAGGTTATVAIDGDMTFADFRAAVNAAAATTGVRASVLQVSATDQRLVLSAEDTNKAISITDASGIVGGFLTSELQAAQPALFEIDGIALSRDNNEIDDAVSGVTLSLFQAEPGALIDVSIEPRLAEAKDRIVDFVNAYNAFRDFVERQSVVGEDGAVSADSILFGDPTLRRVTADLAALTGLSVDGLAPGAISTLRDIGITIDGANRLAIDDGKLDQGLVGDLDALRKIFEFDAVAVPATLAVTGRSNSFGATSFAVQIVDADNDGVPESATIDGIAAEISNKAIKAPDGSAYEGLSFFWSGTGSESVTVDLSQGIADRLWNRLEEVLDPLKGELQEVTTTLDETSAGYLEDIERIELRAANARDLLIERFAAMEETLSLANTMLEQLKAQTAAWSGRN